MPTTMTFDNSRADGHVGICFSGHSATEQGDRDTGLRLCASMSTLASVVEAYVETLGIGYSLSVCPGDMDGVPVRTIRWESADDEIMAPIVETVRQIASLLAAQYPEHIKVQSRG